MLIARERSEISLDLSAGCAVTIGNFDGVHQGHQKLIHRVLHKARAEQLVSVCLTFCPHPLRVLVGPRTPPLITVRDRKLDLLDELGLDMALMLNFTKELAALEPEEFVATYLADWLNTKRLVVGYDYTFGKARRGDFALLSRLGQEHGFTCEQLEPVILDGAVVSSTRIRDLIQAGKVWEASRLLGRYYMVRGAVAHGKGRGGKLLGFPTANLEMENELHPQTGVYAVWAELNGQPHPAVANIGYNPTFGNDEISMEAHILDFDQDIYGQDLHVHFVQRLRSERKFSGLDELMARIREDVELARQVLAAPEAQL